MPDQTKSETAFLSGLSHALRSPLVSIRGYNDLLLTETQGPLTVKQRRSLERMRQSIIQLIDVVERLLDQATRGEQIIAPPAATAIRSKKKVSVHAPQPVHPERSAAKSKGDTIEVCPSTGSGRAGREWLQNV